MTRPAAALILAVLSLVPFAHAADRPNIVPGGDPYGEEPEREAVQVDTLIERADLGPDTYTLVAAGDPVPEHLATLPRRPRIAPTKARTTRA